jgi:RHS repeat-associated protein
MNDKGAVTTSAARSITVAGTVVSGNVYYIHTDHLDTPREITNEQNQTVWKNPPLTEPFGMTPVDEDPDGDGQAFTFNLRFPGQYYDQETGTHYNYFRDNYLPDFGRYGQSDPIGLEGGINTYAYVNNNPLIFVDPLGLGLKHHSGQKIDCGGGCWIRIDFTLNEDTGETVRHLHWGCSRQEEGACGESGGKSHDGYWDDLPNKIKKCAMQHGFQGGSKDPLFEILNEIVRIIVENWLSTESPSSPPSVDPVDELMGKDKNPPSRPAYPIPPLLPLPIPIP